VPTRDNLSFRNVLQVDAPNSCVMCDEEVESARHLFIHCEVAMEVWHEVMRWFGNSFITPPDFSFIGSVGVEWKETRKSGRVFGLFGILLCGFCGELEMTKFSII
jgi:hypothetical protein